MWVAIDSMSGARVMCTEYCINRVGSNHHWFELASLGIPTPSTALPVDEHMNMLTCKQPSFAMHAQEITGRGVSHLGAENVWDACCCNARLCYAVLFMLDLSFITLVPICALLSLPTIQMLNAFGSAHGSRPNILDLPSQHPAEQDAGSQHRQFHTNQRCA